MDYLSRRDLSALRMMVGRSPIRYQSGATISSSSNPSIVEGLYLLDVGSRCCVDEVDQWHSDLYHCTHTCTFSLNSQSTWHNPEWLHKHVLCFSTLPLTRRMGHRRINHKSLSPKWRSRGCIAAADVGRWPSTRCRFFTTGFSQLPNCSIPKSMGYSRNNRHPMKFSEFSWLPTPQANESPY